MGECHHTVMRIGPPNVCAACGYVEDSNPPVRFERRELTEEEMRAVFGDETYEMFTTSSPRPGTLRVTSIDRVAGTITVTEEPAEWPHKGPAGE